MIFTVSGMARIRIISAPANFSSYLPLALVLHDVLRSQDKILFSAEPLLISLRRDIGASQFSTSESKSSESGKLTCSEIIIFEGAPTTDFAASCRAGPNRKRL